MIQGDQVEKLKNIALVEKNGKYDINKKCYKDVISS